MKKRSMVRAFGLIFCLAWGSWGWTFSNSVDQDVQQWSIFTVQNTSQEKFRWFMEVQPRLGDNVSELDRLLIRPIVGYQVNKHLSVWQGYAWTPGFQPSFSHEHRVFQQIVVDHRARANNLTHRTRLEERFIEGLGPTAVRFRQMLRVVYPLGETKRWALAASEEIFFNLNSIRRGPQGGFDQNRSFVGFTRQVSDVVRLEAGYMAIYVDRRNAPDRLNHNIVFSMGITH